MGQGWPDEVRVTLAPALIREMRAAFEEGLRRGVENGGAMLARSTQEGDGGLQSIELIRVEQESFLTEV